MKTLAAALCCLVIAYAIPVTAQPISAEAVLQAPSESGNPPPVSSPVATPPRVQGGAPGQATTPAFEQAASVRAAIPRSRRATASPHRGSRPTVPATTDIPQRTSSSVPLASARQEVKTADVVRIALILTLMAIIPALLVCMTSFVRIVVVLAMIRHAFGMPETPPNPVLISLAIFLTAFSMMPTFEAINSKALGPFLDGTMTVAEAVDRGSGPARDFMLRQTRDQDIKAMYDISHKPLPSAAAQVDLLQLVPAFMLNELRVAFRIGFVILLPFLLIDLVVSSILLALGMLMVPPSTLALPLKVLMFVLVDGWSLILQGVLGSFH